MVSILNHDIKEGDLSTSPGYTSAFLRCTTECVYVLNVQEWRFQQKKIFLVLMCSLGSSLAPPDVGVGLGERVTGPVCIFPLSARDLSAFSFHKEEFEVTSLDFVVSFWRYFRKPRSPRAQGGTVCGLRLALGLCTFFLPVTSVWIHLHRQTIPIPDEGQQFQGRS